jgi:hypothetical protein
MDGVPSGDKQRNWTSCAMRGFLTAVAALFLLAGLFLWLLRVGSGEIMLSQGSSRTTAERLAYNRWYAGIWIGMSWLAILALLAYKRWPLAVTVISLAVFLALVLSAVFEKDLYAAYLSLRH